MNNSRGFTLVELLAVMIILGIFASMAVVKFIKFDQTATNKAVIIALDELNTREKLIWFDVKLSVDEDIDEVIWQRMEQQLNIGDGTTVSADENGGTITINSDTVKVIRRHPTQVEPGRWSRP